jgi:hypothetical protein
MTVTIGMDGRPYTDGQLIGRDMNGQSLSVDTPFLIDTGAQISAINEDNARLFQKSRVIGAGASGAGGEGLTIYRCVTMQFKRAKQHGRGEEKVRCHLPWAVVRRPYCILGIDQLKATRTDIYSGLQLRATWERTLPACSCRAKAIRETIRQTSRQDACAPRSHPSENRYMSALPRRWAG